MEKIALVVLDICDDKNLSILAIERSLAFNKIARVYTLSDINFYGGSTLIPISSTAPIDQAALLRKLLNLSVENYFLFANWDSFIAYPNNWQNDFFRYDFIGTPLWIDENAYFIGSQNFCMVSRQLISHVISKIEKAKNSPIWSKYIIYSQLDHYLSLGLNFANQDSSQLFSYESGPQPKNYFGISGSANFPFFYTEKVLLENTNEISIRQRSPLAILNYLRHCLQTGKIELFKTSVQEFEKKPNLKNALAYELSINPLSELPMIIQNFNSVDILNL